MERRDATDLETEPDPQMDPGALEHPEQPQQPDGATVEANTLLPADDIEGYRVRWEAIQAAFVDEPRKAVAQADELVDEVIRQLGDTFARERAKLEEGWERGDDVSTEDLRVSLQHYRSFFKRLLAA